MGFSKSFGLLPIFTMLVSSATSVLVSIVSLPAVAQSHKGLTFQGYLKDSAGSSVTVSGVTVTSKLISPNGCVLLQETHSGVNLVDGFFTVVIGKGARGGSDRGFSLKEVFSNSSNRSALDPVSGAAGSCNYVPTSDDARTVALEFSVGADAIKADFNVRASAFAVWAESAEDSLKLDGKASSAFLQTNTGLGLTQAKLEEFISTMVSVSGGAVRWNGANFVSYNPSDASYLSSSSVTDTHIQSVGWSKVSAVPSGLTQIGGLSCADGKILKRVSGSWACADDDAGGGGGGGSVTAVSSTNAYLSVADGGTTPALTLHVGTGANTVAAGNDARFSDARTPTGAASGDLDGNYPNPSVVALRGVAIAAGAPVSGNFLKYNGTDWDDAAVAIGDVTNLSTQLGNKLDQSQMPASCSAHQTLHFVSVTGSWSCSNIDSLNADKITAGTLNIARIPTGTTGSTVAVGNDGRFPSGDCGSGNKMRFASGAWICEAESGGGGTPGGANTQVQFNNAGSFGASSSLTWSGSTLTVNGTVAASTLQGPNAFTTLTVAAGTAPGAAGQDLLLKGGAPSNPSLTGPGSVILQPGVDDYDSGHVQIRNGAGAAVMTVGALGAASGGRVGIGTTNPTARLEVAGQIVSKTHDNGSSMSFDFNNGNTQITSASCGAMTLSNMVDGGSYVVAVLGTASGTCTYSHAGLTFLSNYTGPTTVGTRSLISFQRVGSYVFVNWNTGYQ